MKNIIRVRELSDREIEKLDKRKGFRDFNSNNVAFDITPDALIKAIRKINKNFLK